MQEIRYAVRVLARTPVVTLTVVLLLAVGIGAPTALYTVARGVLIRPLPFVEPDRLVQFGTVGVLEFKAYREQCAAFESLASYSVIAKTLVGTEPERVSAVAAERTLFDLLGVRPLAGRTFSAADSVPVAVLSEGLWKRRFGADATMSGRTIVLDGVPHTVVGIMPDTFRFPYGPTAPDLWIPAELPQTESWFQRIDAAVGRLKPGITLHAATAELRAVAERLEPLSRSNPSRTVVLRPLHEAVVGRARRGIWILLGAAGLLLLLACVNIANLLLLRTETRKRDVAVALALGASRARMVVQFLTESLLVAAGGTVGALIVALSGLRLMLTYLPAYLPRVAEVGLDWSVFGFLLAVGGTTGIAFGLAPALRAFKTDTGQILNTYDARTSRGRTSTTIVRVLVVAEVAIAFVLAVAAGLLLRTFMALERAPSGISAERVLTLRLDSTAAHRDPRGAQAATGGMTRQGRYFHDIEQRVRAIPGVRDTGFVTRLPIQHAGNSGQFSVPGQPLPPGQRGFPVRLREASPGYFQAMGIPLLAGSLFAAREDGIVVNEALVRQHLSGEDPIGRVLDRGTIVGVVGDVRQNLSAPAEPEIYRPLGRTSYAAANLVVATHVPPASVVPAVRAAVREVNTNQAIFDVRTMDDVVMAAHGDLNLSLALVGLFAGVALVLATAGIYGVMSYSVALRHKEFGIRLALGADAGRLLRLVAMHAATVIAMGVAIGAAAAAGLTQVLRTLLYDVTPTDPLTFVATASIVAAVAAAASLQPALRAGRVDPMIILRHE